MTNKFLYKSGSNVKYLTAVCENCFTFLEMKLVQIDGNVVRGLVQCWAYK